MVRPAKRSQEQVFNELYSTLRKFRSDTPASHERVDPILRMLLQAYAHELANLETDLQDTWNVARTALLKTVCGYAGRWPTPAHCVMQCTTVDPVVEIDSHIRFFYRESREGARTYFFSPLTDWPVLSAVTEVAVLRRGDFLLPVSPGTPERDLRAAIERYPSESDTPWQLYLGITFSGPPSALNQAVIYLDIAPELRPQLQWGYWHPLNRSAATRDTGFCPGKTSWLDRVLAPAGADDWGGLRTSADLFSDLTDSFVVLPEDIAGRWSVGPPPKELIDTPAPFEGQPTLTESANCYWLRIDLPPRGSRAPFAKGVNLLFDTIVAANRYSLTLFRHTGGAQLIDVVIPESADSVLTIENVTDSEGRRYLSADSTESTDSHPRYTLTERDGHVVLWFDFMHAAEGTPNSLSVEYSVTDGVSANGIERGHISRMYEGHPGLSEVKNITPSTGAIPARTQQQLQQEVTVRLRQRDRALTFEDVAAWSRSFDPRIAQAACRAGTRRIDGCVQRCTVVALTVDPEDFGSDEEIELLKSRLERFLKLRSVVNTQYLVEVDHT